MDVNKRQKQTVLFGVKLKPRDFRKIERKYKRENKCESFLPPFLILTIILSRTSRTVREV
jgi:hypothetical protein